LEHFEQGRRKQNKKTKMVMIRVTTAFGGALAGCADDDLPPKPQDPYCSKFEYDYSDEEWELDKLASRHYGYYYIGNTAYPDTDDKQKSSSSSSSSTLKGKLKSGFGSGSKATGS
jgi:hypothetical protein